MPILQIDGLEEVCSHITRIEGLVIRQRIRRSPGEGPARLEREAQGIYTSPLVLTVPEAKAWGFTRWLEACEAGRSNGRTATSVLATAAISFTAVRSVLR